MILHIAGDVRWSGPNTAVATFLGRTYTFSNTWVILAAMTGAPVIPVFCQMAPEGLNRLEFLPAFHVPPDASAAEKTSPWVQSCLRGIEQRVQDDPANSNDYFFWAETPEFLTEPPDRDAAGKRPESTVGMGLFFLFRRLGGFPAFP
jgi:KDO2-lipid IV(A) lauroyltransferase